MEQKILFVIVGLALVAGFLTWLPVQAGYDHAAQTNTVFTGFDFGEDSQAYAAYVRSGVDGNPFFLKNNSTSESQDGRYVVLYFTLLAFVVKFTGVGIDIVWHVFRFFIIFFLAFTVWRVGGELFSEKKPRIIFYILFLFGGGFGWMVSVLGGVIPLLSRLYSTDLTYYLGYTVFSFMFHSLGMLALAFILWETIFLARWLNGKDSKQMAFATIFILLAFFVHPAAGVVGGLLAGIIFVWHVANSPSGNWKNHFSLLFENGKFLAAGALLIAAYTLWARGDAIYLFHQAIYLTWDKHEPFWMYPFAMGLPLILGIYAMTRKQFELGPLFFVFKVLFVIALALSLFFPAGVKYLYLIYPALVGWTVVGLKYVVNQVAMRLSISERVLTIVTIIVICASVPFVVENRVADVVEGDQYYLTQGESAAIDWLNAQPRGVVLSSPEVGRVLSWKTSQQAFLAHGFLTVDYSLKQAILSTFLDNSSSLAEKQNVLSSNDITYVFYGPREHVLGVVDLALELESLYSEKGVTIFRVRES